MTVVQCDSIYCSLLAKLLFPFQLKQLSIKITAVLKKNFKFILLFDVRALEVNLMLKEKLSTDNQDTNAGVACFNTRKIYTFCNNVVKINNLV